MLEKAILKIKTEMEQNNNNSYIQIVGEFLLRYLESDPSAAEKILTEEKTIAKSLDEMRKAAEKKKVGNCAVLTDQEGFEIVFKYFGIEAGAAKVEVKNHAATRPVKKNIDFDVKLEDLL